MVMVSAEIQIKFQSLF